MRQIIYNFMIAQSFYIAKFWNYGSKSDVTKFLQKGLFGPDQMSIPLNELLYDKPRTTRILGLTIIWSNVDFKSLRKVLGKVEKTSYYSRFRPVKISPTLKAKTLYLTCI